MNEMRKSSEVKFKIYEFKQFIKINFEYNFVV